ncbi:MAG: VWA domain-containing protein [Planctomycetota bacterium]
MFVVDRSDSIPAAQRQFVIDRIKEAQSQRDQKRGDFVGVVVFGKDAGVEQAPRQDDLDLRDVQTIIDSEATDIQAAIQLAIAAFPEEVGGKRLVLFSDGNENLGRAVEETRAARSVGIHVDVVPIRYEYGSEISVDKMLVKSEVSAGEPYSLQAVISSTREAEVKIHLYENGELVPQVDNVRKLVDGRNYIEFPNIRHDSVGKYDYELKVEVLDGDQDAITENNVGHAFTMIRGEAKVLFCAVEPELDANIVAALRKEKIQVDVIEPDALPRELSDYFEYGAVVFSNVGAHRISEEKMTMFKNMVNGLGIGFVMIGGEESFGAGGYQGTPIEELLPVSMELKQKKKLPNGALAMVVHSCELNNGNHWARQVVQQAIKILSPQDYAGVLYYDFQASDQWLFPLKKCTNKQGMYNKLRNFNPGDMPSFRGIMQMAYTGLKGLRGKAAIKHMIILTDGDPSMPMPALLNKITKQERITISTICYGAHGNVWPQAMKDLAKMGGGKAHYLKGPEKLPEIFIREATRVRKSLISEKPFVPVVRSWGQMLRDLEGSTLPILNGYVLTSAKPLADLLLVHPGTTDDPTQDPVLAAWTYGLGKSVAFTSDAGRRWGTEWVNWGEYQRFWGQLIRWVAKPQQSPLFNVKRQVIDGELRVVAELITPDGKFIDGVPIEARIVTPGVDGEVHQIDLRQVQRGRYEGPGIPVDERGTYPIHLRAKIDGVEISYTTGASVSYSPEYRQLATNQDLLTRLAEAGGGRWIDDPKASNFFTRDFKLSHTVQEVWSSLLIWAVILFFADVFIRRVMLDYKGAYTKVRERLSRKQRAEGSSEGSDRMASLLKAKARAETKSVADVEAEEGPELDSSYDATSAPSEPAASKSAKRSQEAPKPEDEAPAFTSRLLKAKRRARGDQDDK